VSIKALSDNNVNNTPGIGSSPAGSSSMLSSTVPKMVRGVTGVKLGLPVLIATVGAEVGPILGKELPDG